MSKRRIMLCAVLVAVLGQAALGTTLRFQQGAPHPLNGSTYTSAQDTYIYSAWSMAPDGTQTTLHEADNYGASSVLRLGIYEMADVYQIGLGLMRFGSLTAGGRPLAAARLYLYVSESPNALGVTWGPMFDADKDWTAGHSNGQPEVGASCCSQKRYTQTNWTIAPPVSWWNNTSNYFIPTGRVGPGSIEVCAELPASMVSSWITNPSGNAGLMLYFGAGNDFVGVASSDSLDQSMRPALELDTVPEPSAIAALAGGLLMLVTCARQQIRRAIGSLTPNLF